MNQIILNPTQEKVVNEAVNWYFRSSEQIFEIDGPAGTGKSVVLHEIINRIGINPSRYKAMAYTGQAAIIMRLKGFNNAASIHSTLYYRVEQEEFSNDPNAILYNTEFNVKQKSYKFVPISQDVFNRMNISLLVIDEGYMVPDYMKKVIVQYGVKILVAGDQKQLPPIGGNPAFLIGPNVHHLTEIMRQEKNNPIIYLANRAMQGQPIHCGIYGNNVLVIEDDELTPQMILDMGITICGTNKTRDYINKSVRNLLRRNPQCPEYGDRIICRENDWDMVVDNIALANGLSGYLISDVDASSFNRNGETIRIDFLPDLLNIPFLNVYCNYNYFKSDYNERNKIKNNIYRKGELFEYAYALTTHLSQGAEYQAGIYLEEFLRPEMQNALLYTGITRFREKMIFVKHKYKYY